MHSRISSEQNAAFDEIYKHVPAEQAARLKEFRLSHPYKQIKIGNARWEYISCGAGDQTILLLPGALSVGESTFPLITALEKEHRIIAPSYALSLNMTGLCEGMAGILESESLKQVHVFGGSYGGLVAQYFVRQFPEMVRSLLLSHTFILTPKHTKPLWLVGKLFPLFPQNLLVPFLELRLNRMLLSKLRSVNHPEAELWRAYLNEALASGLFKEIFVHQNRCLLELAQQAQFRSEDLAKWDGKVLIIESNDDPAISVRDRTLLRSVYPQAQVNTFADSGHASSILNREEVVSIIRSFVICR